MATTGAWLQIHGIISKVRAMVQKGQIEYEGTSWWLHVSDSSPVFHRLNVYGWVANFTCVRFGLVMRPGSVFVL